MILQRLKKNAENILLAMVLVSLFLVFSELVWASFKGFDFSDESFYHIGYFFHDEPSYSVMFFHRLYDWLFGFLHLNFVQNRILGLVIAFFSFLFLGKEIVEFFDIKEKWVSVLVVVTVSFLGNAVFPMSVNYNLFSVVFSACFVGVMLRSVRTSNFWWGVVAGILILLMVVNKFTNVLLVGYVLFLFVVAFRRRNKAKYYGYFSLLLLVSGGVALLVFFGSFSELTQKFDGLLTGLSLTSGYGLGYMMERLLSDVSFFLPKLLLLVPFAVVGWVVKQISVFSHTKKKHVIAFVFVLAVLYYVFHFGFFLSKPIIPLFYLMLVLVVVFVLLLQEKKVDKSTVLLVFMLLTIPFVASAGTNNSLFTQSILYGGITASALVILIDKIEWRWLRYFFLLILPVVAVFQTGYNKLFDAYRVGNLLEMNYKVKNSTYLNGLQVKKKTAVIFDKLQEFKQHPATKIFVPAHQLGVGLICEKEVIPFTWIDKKRYKFIASNFRYYPNVENEHILFFIPTEDKDEIIKQLNQVEGLNFGSKYTFVSRIELPEVKSYKWFDVFDKK